MTSQPDHLLLKTCYARVKVSRSHLGWCCGTSCKAERLSNLRGMQTCGHCATETVFEEQTRAHDLFSFFFFQQPNLHIHHDLHIRTRYTRVQVGFQHP